MESLISRSRSTGCERRRPSLNGEIMTIKTLSPGLGVSPQIGPADVAALAASGFRSIICNRPDDEERSEEHTSELQSLMRTSYAVFCFKKKKSIVILHSTIT